MSITVEAPAKINLFLKVIRKRTDGYHDICSLVQSVSLCDTLTFTQIPSGIVIESEAPGVPIGPDNLIWKAIEAAGRRQPSKAILTSLVLRLPYPRQEAIVRPAGVLVVAKQLPDQCSILHHGAEEHR